MGARFLFTVLLLPIAMIALAPNAMAQSSGEVFDDAKVLSAAEERQVQDTFERASEDSGHPLYAFLVENTNVAVADRHEFLTETASQEDVPSDAGVILVDTEDRWGLVDVPGGADQAVYDAMEPYFSDGNFAEGLMAGAVEYQDSLSAAPELLTAGGVLGALALLGGGTAYLWNRRRKERELEKQREVAEREFAELTERISEFDERERLVAGYLEAQRPLLDQKCEHEIEAKIQDARSAGFGNEFNEAASRLASDPKAARERIEHGRRLLDSALKEDEPPTAP